MSNKSKAQAKERPEGSHKEKPQAKQPVNEARRASINLPYLPGSRGLYGAHARAQVIHYIAQQLNDSVSEDQILAVLFIYFNPETARRYLNLAKQLIGHGT